MLLASSAFGGAPATCIEDERTLWHWGTPSHQQHISRHHENVRGLPHSIYCSTDHWDRALLFVSSHEDGQGKRREKVVSAGLLAWFDFSSGEICSPRGWTWWKMVLTTGWRQQYHLSHPCSNFCFNLPRRCMWEERSVPLANKMRMTNWEETLRANLVADGQSEDKRVWFRHASGYFRLGGGFSDFLALSSTLTLTERMKGPEMRFFSVFQWFYQHLTSDAVFQFREEKAGP